MKIIYFTHTLRFLFSQMRSAPLSSLLGHGEEPRGRKRKDEENREEEEPEPHGPCSTPLDKTTSARESQAEARLFALPAEVRVK